MNKKKTITRGIKLIAFALAVILTTYFLQVFLLKRIDNNSLRMDAFYLEDKGSLDAVLIGASDVYAGYSAPYAYEKYGYTSYPYATQSAPANIVLPQIKEVIKYQNPKMIIVEINAFLYKDSEIPSEASSRMFLDNIPDDEIKFDYIQRYFSADKRPEYFLPIIKYHGSWTDYPWKVKFLTAELQLKERGYSLFRGYKTTANEFHPPVKVYNDTLEQLDTTVPMGVNGERCLRETLEYLKDKGITNVVFMRFPHVVRRHAIARCQRTNEAEKIIKSYGYDFVNLERHSVREGFDVNKDFYNWDHLNVYGSEKLTDYIANMLLNDYGMTKAELTDAQKAEWDVSVDYYHKIYNYSVAMINSRKKQGKTGDGGVTISEDAVSIEEINKYAEKQKSTDKNKTAEDKALDQQAIQDTPDDGNVAE